VGSLEKVFGEGPPKLWEKVGFLEDFFLGRTTKIVGKAGTLGKELQERGKNGISGDFFFGGGRTTKIVGKAGIS